MKLFKNILAILLVSVLAFSCKSDKKSSDEMIEDSVEEVIETVDETYEATEDAVEEAVEEAADTIEAVVDEVAKDAEAVQVDASVEEAVAVAASTAIVAVYPKDSELAAEVNKAMNDLLQDNASLQPYFDKAYGFVIFPKITKAGLGVGGAGGKGLVFENKTVIGKASIAQATFGLQAGGQQYEEVIFFENKEALDKFKAGKIKFSGQVSAVALQKGVSFDVAYQNSVAVFTKVRGGIMAEASVGGQKFKYTDGI